MYRPQEKEQRYMLAYVTKACQENLELVSSSPQPIHNELGELVAICHTTDFLFK